MRLSMHAPSVAICLCALSLSGAAVADSSRIDGARLSPAANMEAFVLDIQSAAGLAAGGKLLYDADSVKKAWGQYCGSSRQASERGEFRRAVQEASKALYLGQREGLIHAQAYAARDLAIAHNWAGDLEGGARWAHHALELSSKITVNMNVDYEIRSEAFKVLGDVAFRRGAFTDALNQYESSLKAFPLLGGGMQKDLTRLSVANAQFRLKNPQAQTIFKSLADSSDPLVRLSALRGLVLTQMEAGDTNLATDTVERLLKAANESKAPYQALWALHLAARINVQLGRMKEAAGLALQAVDAAENVRAVFRSSEIKAGFFNSIQEVFDLAMKLLARTGRAEDAFIVSERSRARATLELLRNARDSGQQQLNADRIGTIADMQGLLPVNTNLVSYHVLEDETLAWVLSKNSLQGSRLTIGRRTLQQEIERFRKSIESDDQGQVLVGAESLYQKLIAPLNLPPGRSVIVVAHSSLHFLPFQALRGPLGWWIEERPISFALSASTLSAGNASLRAGLNQIFAFGNPDVGDRSLDLPGAEDEAKALASLYPETRVFIRKDASKANVIAEAPKAGVLHIAAHAFVDELDPMYSYIKLADPLRKGDLQARELQQLQLQQTRLVALSACSSGLGRVAQGDEFWGFKRAVMATGVPRLLVSLWPVEDQATAKLMELFYKAAADMPPSKALRQAQIELIRIPGNSQPHRWAPFVLVGDAM